MTTRTLNHPNRFIIGLLAVQVFLFLSERFRWFPFNEHKGWTVLIALGVVGLAVVVMLVWGLVCLVLRRRFQFSFRSLLVFLVAVSIPLGWFAWEMQQARKQREAVEAIVQADGKTHYVPWKELLTLEQALAQRSHVRSKRPSLRWLRRVLGNDFFDDVFGVEGIGYAFGDSELELVKKLPKLEYVNLFRTNVTNAGLEHLKGLSYLRHLTVFGGEVTEEGLDSLRQALPHCEIP
jgi:hypothetical protein